MNNYIIFYIWFPIIWNKIDKGTSKRSRGAEFYSESFIGYITVCSVCTERILFLSLLPAFQCTPYCDLPLHAQNHNNLHGIYEYYGYRHKQELCYISKAK